MFKNKIKIFVCCFGLIVSMVLTGMEEKIPPYLTGWKHLRKLDMEKNKLQDTKDSKDSDAWRIKDGNLEINLSEDEYIRYEPFSEIWNALNNIDFPFLLLMLRDKNYFYHPLAPVIGGKVEGLSILTDIAEKWINPFTGATMYQVEVYFGGPDGEFYLLTAKAGQDFFKNALCIPNKDDKRIFTLKEELSNFYSGDPVYEFVSDLFNKYSNDEDTRNKWESWKIKENRAEARKNANLKEKEEERIKEEEKKRQELEKRKREEQQKLDEQKKLQEEQKKLEKQKIEKPKIEKPKPEKQKNLEKQQKLEKQKLEKKGENEKKQEEQQKFAEIKRKLEEQLKLEEKLREEEELRKLKKEQLVQRRLEEKKQSEKNKQNIISDDLLENLKDFTLSLQHLSKSLYMR